jgi:DNA repair protein REV1
LNGLCNSAILMPVVDTFQDEEGEEYEASKFGGFGDYMRRKKIKLQNLDSEIRSSSTGKPPIFRGIVAHVNGYTQPSLNDLHHLIVSHGGGFLQYLDGKTAVTHVIAGNLTPKKKVEFARYRIVKPAWVVESVKAGRLLPWDAFRVVDEGVAQKVLGFDNGQIVSQTNSQRAGYRDQTDTSWYTSQIKKKMDAGGAPEDHGPPDPATANLDVDATFEHDSSPTAPATIEPPLGGNPQPAVDGRDGANEALVEDSAHMRQELGLGRDFDATAVNETMKIQATIADEQDTGPDEPEPTRWGQRSGGAVSAETTSIGKSKLVHAGSRSPEKRQLTAEEHNARLLSDPHLAKSSTANPDFLNQYYQESRLHHLSAWKADLKAQLQARAQEKSSWQKTKRVPASRRYIMHVDFDSFFAAVSLRKNPELADKPVVIAHGSGPSSEIASCNYPARKFGIKNGMWMKSALEQCSSLKVLPYDFKAYEEASRQFYEAILATDGIVQSVSIDEALVDISRQCIEAGESDGKVAPEESIRREQARAWEVAEKLRALVKEKTGCHVSVGIGNNILLAKVALRKAKPAGQHLVKPEEMLDFIGELAVTDLPGVAYSLSGKLEELGVRLVKDIRALTKERLVNSLGPKTGEKLWEYSRGIDKAEVGEQAIRKSVSAEISWGIRFVTQQQADEFVQCLCDELSRRLVEQAVKGKQLTMKIMRRAADAPLDPPKSMGHGKCDTFNKSVVLGVATNDKAVLGREALSILKGFGFSPGELRGIGVQMTKLEPLKPISSSASSPFDSSQRRLQFKKPETSPLVAAAQPTGASSGGSRSRHDTASHASPTVQNLTDVPEPIEEVPTQEKPAAAKAIAGVIGKDNQASEDAKNNLLNLSGTQFLLPTQLDPTVLEELPANIRSKLASKQIQITGRLAGTTARLSDDEVESRSASPFPPADQEFDLPSQSQLDPEILSALPEDVKNEVLAHYGAVAAKARREGRSQQLLPRSSGKQKSPFPTKKVASTPTKKHKSSGLMGRGKSKSNGGPLPTLTQSNFVAARDTKTNTSRDSGSHVIDEEISESFLAELPADIRAEILAEQKRNRMKMKSGLDLGTKRRKGRANEVPADDNLLTGQRRLRLPPLPVKPTFTSRRLSTLPELREAMTAWVDEFSGANEEAPFDEDVGALASYLQKVVIDELNLEKAVSVVDWLSYVVNSKDMAEAQLRTSWANVLDRLKRDVQSAVTRRNLPPVVFSTV